MCPFLRVCSLSGAEVSSWLLPAGPTNSIAYRYPYIKECEFEKRFLPNIHTHTHTRKPSPLVYFSVFPTSEHLFFIFSLFHGRAHTHAYTYTHIDKHTISIRAGRASSCAICLCSSKLVAASALSIAASYLPHTHFEYKGIFMRVYECNDSFSPFPSSSLR